MKWADYAITAVRYSSDRSHITDLEVRIDNDSSLGPGVEWRRQDVVLAIGKGHSFMTAFRVGDTFSQRALVEVIAIGSEHFLRTDRNYRRSDNLGELPELSSPGLASPMFR